MRYAAIILLGGALSIADAAESKKSAPNLAALPAPVAGPVDYAKDIQPIFAKHCYPCHGPEKHKSGLRLDVQADALRGGDSGAVIVPGKSAESVLIHNVAGLDPDYVMPPEGEGDRLARGEIAKLRAWIDRGAVWPKEADGYATRAVNHWAFKPPRGPNLPNVANARWPRNPIDTFVLARLEQEKIKPSPEADRVTLIRRLSFDLLGLPPSREDVKAFVDDPRPDFYERLVDRLLASPHFGERWARHWLDLARYGDSDGYEKDNDRPYAYLFRDWVIRAINRDQPFDQFTIDQLAGDLLPDTDDRKKIATAFHRQTLTNRENGVDQEEFRIKAVVDRVSTTGAVWLGLTVACAECHTHKFDPITQREFYQLFAFFNNASEKDIPAPQPAEVAAYEQQLAPWLARLAEIEAPLKAYKADPSPQAARVEWERNLRLPSARWAVLAPTKVLAASETMQSELTPDADHSIAPGGKGRRFTVEAPADLKGITGFRLEALPDIGKTVGRGAKGDFTLSEFRVSARIAGGEETPIRLVSARADVAADGREAGNALDGNSETGWSIGEQIHQPHVIVFETATPLDLPPGALLVFKLEQPGSGVVNRFRLSASASAAPLEPSPVSDQVVAALARPADRRTGEEAAAIDRHYFEHVDPQGALLAQKVAEHQVAKPKAPQTTAAILVADERKTHVHVRGDFLRQGDEVRPGVLAVLQPFRPREEKPDRLDLARWIVDPANPLTARVAVNQAWKNLFGRGLVATTDDFGTRGERPSHPELLDWLALAFGGRSPHAGSRPSAPGAQPALNWSRKALIRLIVTSSTYRQSSHIRPDLIERDPTNTLLARQNRFRLDAENVRDAYLAAAGLLNREIGGPGVRPRLPSATAMGYFSAKAWPETKGAHAYRRGLYIFFKRTAPYPALMTFDAPDGNMACTRRERSNTPLQALTLLNDPVFFECAQALGGRIASAPGTIDDRLRQAFQICLSREPTDAEMTHLRELHAGQAARVRAEPESAAGITGASNETAEVAGDGPERSRDKPVPTTGQVDPRVAETATLVLVCRTLMNLDEFLTRE